MRLIFLTTLLSFASCTRGLLIDDRDSSISYVPTWEHFPDATAYKGTTTDNACLTSEGCRFTFPFTGSGFTLTRFIITDIPIPLNATVTVDGGEKPLIVIPDGSTDTVVYSLQSLNYGAHSAEVTLVSYNGVKSHFRLDVIDVNQTAPALPPPVSPPPNTNTTGGNTTTPGIPSTPPPGTTNNLSQKKVPMNAVVGGSVGGVAVLCLSALGLLFAKNRRRRNLISEKELGADAPFASSDGHMNGPSQPIVATMATSPQALSPTTYLNVSPAISTTTPQTFAADPIATAVPPFAVPSSTQYAKREDDDFDPSVLMTPPGSITTSASTANRNLNDEQAAFIADLYRQGMAAPDVARIAENMLRDGAPSESGNGEGPSTVTMPVVPSQPPAFPPAYDFKTT